MDGRTLPGTQTAYFLRAGEGERYLVGGQLATVIARPLDTGGHLEAIVWSGDKGAAFPTHQHARGHEAMLVLDGHVELALGPRRYLLSRGDYASIPAGTPHGHHLRSHGSRMLVWTVNGLAVKLCASLGGPFGGLSYPPGPAVPLSPEAMARAEAGTDVRFVTDTAAARGPEPHDSKLPDAMAPYCVETGEGERLLAGDQLFTFLSHQGHTQGAFIALMTAGPTGAPIPKHFHEKHTETFFCVDGRMTMWAGDEEVSMAPGDFLHVPAGTVHAYRLDAPYTRFAGFLAPGLFEPFFRAICEPYEGHTFPVTPGPVRFDRVMALLPGLDLRLVGPPPGPPPGT